MRVADLRQRVAQQFVVYEELVGKKVDVEQQTHSRRYPAFHGARFEICELNDGGHSDIHQRHFVDFVHCGVDFGGVLRVPAAFAQLPKHQNAQPAEHQQKDGDIAVVNEETCLSRALEPPIYLICIEESAA